jgi:hypothetical protein
MSRTTKFMLKWRRSAMRRRIEINSSSKRNVRFTDLGFIKS